MFLNRLVQDFADNSRAGRVEACGADWDTWRVCVPVRPVGRMHCGVSEEVALPGGHAEFPNSRKFSLGFDSFGHDAGADLCRETDHRRAECPLALVAVDSGDKAPVQVDDVGAQLQDVAH